MNQTHKQQIADLLRLKSEHMGSQSKAAAACKISPANATQILKRNWENISDKLWRQVGAALGYQPVEWTTVETSLYTDLKNLLHDAQTYSLTAYYVAPAGAGKSFTTKEYASIFPNVYRLECADYWNKKTFLTELLTAVGGHPEGKNIAYLMKDIRRLVLEAESPLIILDEADKLRDEVFYFFITLYNELSHHCGILMLSTNHIELRMLRGIERNKKGYQEIYSRIGRKFITCKAPNSKDVVAICMANGVDDQKLISSINEDCAGDLRRVERRIHAIRRKKQVEVPVIHEAHAVQLQGMTDEPKETEVSHAG